MNKKIYLYNPQLLSLAGVSVKDYFKRSKIPPKYSFFRDMIKSGKINILVSDNFSSFTKKIKNKILLKFIFFIETYFLKFFEIYLWLIINGCFGKTKVTFNKNQIKENDILIFFSNCVLDTEHPSKNIETLKHLKCKKIIHLSHYKHFTSTISKNLKKIDNYYLAFENNLKKNSKYFNKHFDYKKDFLQLMYVARESFKNNKKFNQRKNKAMSIGSFQVLSPESINSSFRDCYEFYKSNVTSEIRYEIYKNSNHNKHLIECFNSEITPQQDFSKRDYYKIDLNKKFNEYQMFICGEELGDAPGISFVEGMKCGCVFIGLDDYCYKDIGLIDGHNYIAYSNDLNEVLDKIKFYQKNYEKLENISKNSYNIASEKFNSKYVQNQFYQFCYNI